MQARDMSPRKLMSLADERALCELLLHIPDRSSGDQAQMDLSSKMLERYLRKNPELINMGLPSFADHSPLSFYMSMLNATRKILLQKPYISVLSIDSLNYSHDGHSTLAYLWEASSAVTVLDLASIEKTTLNYNDNKSLPPVSYLVVLNNRELLDRLEDKIDFELVARYATCKFYNLLLKSGEGERLLLTYPTLRAKLIALIVSVTVGDDIQDIKNYLFSKKGEVLRNVINKDGMASEAKKFADEVKKPETQQPSATFPPRVDDRTATTVVTDTSALMSLDEERMSCFLLNHVQPYKDHDEKNRLTYLLMRNYLKNNLHLLNMGLPSYDGHPPFAYYLGTKPSGRWMMVNSPLYEVLSDTTFNYFDEDGSILASLALSLDFRNLLAIDSVVSRIDKGAFNAYSEALPSACYTLLLNKLSLFQGIALADKIDPLKIAEQAGIDFFKHLIQEKVGVYLLISHPALRSKLNKLMKEHKDHVATKKITEYLNSKEGVVLRDLIEKENHIASRDAVAMNNPHSFSSTGLFKSPGAQPLQRNTKEAEGDGFGYRLMKDGEEPRKQYK